MKTILIPLTLFGIIIIGTITACSESQIPEIQADNGQPPASEPPHSPTQDVKPTPEPDSPEKTPGGSSSETANADVEFVRAIRADDGTWTFHVTVSHPDTGWEDYADGWDVLLEDGTVLKPEADSPFTRLLLHPHVDEQPFTRSQSRILVPAGVTQVLVRAHDLVNGFGGRTIIVDLTTSGGTGFEVVNPLPPSPESRDGGQKWSFTHQNPDGNRWVTGLGNFPNVTPINIRLEAKPDWVLGTATAEGTFWIATLENGIVQGFFVKNGKSTEVEPKPNQIPLASPPVLSLVAGQPVILTASSPPESRFSHPVLLADSGHKAAILENGDLEITDLQGDTVASFELDALPDSRLLQNDQGQILILGDATTRYDHGVLGDQIEGGGLYMVSDDGNGYRAQRIPLPDDSVVEGQTAIWVDVDQDDPKEILLTLSDAAQGARLVLLAENGKLIAESDPIGTGYRWRHQIAAGPFGPAGEWEIVSVRTPHIGGVVEFHRVMGNRLELTARIPGYSSHILGSRNLDMAAAGDFDSDGHIEILVPNQARDALGAIRRTPAGAETVWELPLDGQISTNIAIVQGPGGSLAAAVGLDEGILRIWPME